MLSGTSSEPRTCIGKIGWIPVGAGWVGADRGQSCQGASEALKPLPKPHYDHRIDFFRGLSLIFIFINHIPENAFSYLTSRSFALFELR